MIYINNCKLLIIIGAKILKNINYSIIHPPKLPPQKKVHTSITTKSHPPLSFSNPPAPISLTSHFLRVSPSPSEFLSPRSHHSHRLPQLPSLPPPPKKTLTPPIPSEFLPVPPSFSPPAPTPSPPAQLAPLRHLGVSPRFSCKSLLILNHLKNKLKKS